ncbi:MAG: MFS transporter [Gammaproteobacteria bacterium]|nr:MFS transporter [Gammaproteobacteria bacterium]MDE0414974.1 MFS transporter [Gammaproteobacteria bacterium]MDE0453946.1 MFS transporter [Gammaproteobacteria bacterium]
MNSVSPWNEFRVGWKPLASAVIGKAFSFGTIPIYVVGVFTVPLGEAFGWSRAEVTFSFTVATFTSASLSPLVGWLCDRFGSRPLVIAGTVGYGLGMAIIATSSDWLLRYYASWSLATMLGVGASAIALTRFVAGWFESKRGLALGIMLMGSGLTAFTAPPFVAYLIENFDWRAGYLGLSAAILLIGVPVVVAGMKDAPKKTAPANTSGGDNASGGGVPVQRPSGFRLAFESRAFWLMSIAFCAATFGIAGLISSFNPILRDVGYGAGQAGALTGLIGLFVMVGRLGVGYLLDKLWAPGLTFVALAFGAITCGLLILPALPVWLVVVAAFCLGLAAGAEWDALSYLAAREFGLESYGRVYSLLVVGVAVITAISPPIFGYAFDQTGSYRSLLLLSGVLLVLGPALLLFLKKGRGPVAGH